MKTIYKRELNSYFNTMIGYVYIAIVLVFIGIFFMIYNLLSGYPYFAPSIFATIYVLILAAPILTMKSFAEERRYKTDQMLLTYPVKVSSIVLGKYFAMMTVYAIPLVVSCLCPLVIAWESAGAGSLLIDYSAIFAFLCLGGMFIAIGMYISSLTESPVISLLISALAILAMVMWASLISAIPDTAIASFIGFFIGLVLIVLILYYITRSKILPAVVGVIGIVLLIAVYILDSTLLAGALPNFLSVFSITNAFSNFTSYFVFDLKSLLLFLSVSALFVFLTIQSVQKRRWS